MQLRLELVTGPNAGEARIVGGTGLAFTIGTSAGATWLLPLGPDAPGDIRIEPARDGLVALLQSGAAFLDQRALTADAPRPLLPGALLQVCGHQISVQSGVPAALAASAPGMQPTISSILAAGELSADGTGPSALRDEPETKGDWISELTTGSNTPEKAPRPDWAGLGQFEDSTEAEPAMPLAPALDPTRTFLPDDWALETGTTAAPSDQQNRMAQSRIADATLDTVERPTAAPRDDALALKAFFRGAGLSTEELGHPLPDRLDALGQMLRAALQALARIEESQSRFETELGLATALPHAATRQADAAMLAVAQSPAQAVQTLQTRLADLERTGDALLSGVMSFAQTAREALDPDMIEATSAAEGGMRARLDRAGVAWASYRARHADADPLSTEALAKAIRHTRSGPIPENVSTTSKERPA